MTTPGATLDATGTNRTTRDVRQAALVAGGDLLAMAILAATANLVAIDGLITTVIRPGRRPTSPPRKGSSGPGWPPSWSSRCSTW